MVLMEEAGATPSQIARELGVSESTVRRRLAKWHEDEGELIETDPQRLRSAELVLNTIAGVLSNTEMGEQIGQITGANLATLGQTLKRIIERKATKQEVHAILTNVGGLIRGYTDGVDVYRSIKLPNREPIATESDIKLLDEKINALNKRIALLTGETNGSGEKPHDDRED